jgi:hypothetical protein
VRVQDHQPRDGAGLQPPAQQVHHQDAGGDEGGAPRLVVGQAVCGGHVGGDVQGCRGAGGLPQQLRAQQLALGGIGADDDHHAVRGGALQAQQGGQHLLPGQAGGHDAERIFDRQLADQVLLAGQQGRRQQGLQLLIACLLARHGCVGERWAACCGEEG